MPSSSGARKPGSARSSFALALVAAAILFAAGAPAPRSPADAGRGSTARAQAAISEQFQQARDLRGFVERNLSRAADPAVAFYVSQALEECALARPWAAEAERPGRWSEKAASEMLADACRGFEASAIEPTLIVDLLGRAAASGEPHAIARMLLFRDIAAPKDEVMDALPTLLATGDPAVIRDVGAFLSRGESAWRYGSEEFPAGTAAIAWELAACDFGYACGPTSRLALAQCAFLGQCAPGRYEDSLASYEPPERMAQALRLRDGIVRALRARDWAWLGLG
jgi:hypothetical protein